MIIDDPEIGNESPRAVERDVEDQAYASVIIKRNDQALRHPDDILQVAIEEGKEQHTRTSSSLFLSAVAAGMILGFSAMVVAYSIQIPDASYTGLQRRLFSALFYPLGFIICIMSGTQLFTEQTATAMYPVLDKKSKIKSLIRVWVTVLIGNLLGALVSASFIASADSIVHAREGYMIVAEHLFGYSNFDILLSSILAGWLMAQGGWLVLATPPTSSQILCIYVVTFIIGIGGFHHSIAGAAEAFSYAFISDSPQWFQVFKFIGIAAFGNLIGGSVFVGMLNYGHIRKTA